jgi:hypothetical protein
MAIEIVDFPIKIWWFSIATLVYQTVYTSNFMCTSMWDGDDLLGLPHFPTLWSWFSSIQLKIYLFTLSIHILHKNWQWNSISYPMIFHSIIPEINHPAFLGYSHDYGNNHIYIYTYIPSSIKYHTYSIFQWYLMIFMEPPIYSIDGFMHIDAEDARSWWAARTGSSRA